jgi:serine/threonine-protein kinase
VSTTKKDHDPSGSPPKSQQTLGGVMPPGRPQNPAPSWDDATEMGAAHVPPQQKAQSAAQRGTAPTMAATPRSPSGVMPTLPRETASGTPPAPAAAAPAAVPIGHDPYLGTVVADRYRILKKLGEGGMGVVYLAEHIIIEKRVALKILSEDFARKADLVQRFMQEAKAASKIGHENIVDITDFGETPSGSVFFAMEFLDGSDLAGHVRKGGPMPFERTRHIVTQICRALGAAHAKGIIHRDMKPENVFLVEREGQQDFVKVLDFGIAKMNSMEEGGARLTRTGMIFGTPEYMSPEQAKGDRPDHRVDIYAVGCILYEMLTGDVPFHAETFMGVLTKHMFEQPMPLNQKAPEANIPPDVEAVVMRALAKDRDQRFQTMKEMSLALAACGGMNAGDGWANEPSHVVATGYPPRADESSRQVRLSATAMPIPGPGAVDERATTLPSPKSTGRVIAFVVGSLVLAGGAIAGIIALKNPPPTPTVVTPPTPTPKVDEPKAETPKPIPDKPATPAGPVRHKMVFQSRPAGAEVMRGAEQVGVTPATIEFDEMPVDKPVTVVVKKKGFKDYTIDVSADKSRTFEFDLQPVKTGHGKSQPGVRLPRINEPPPVTAPPPVTPPPSTPKPNGKLRDLKDPFSQGQ